MFSIYSADFNLWLGAGPQGPAFLWHFYGQRGILNKNQLPSRKEDELTIADHCRRYHLICKQVCGPLSPPQILFSKQPASFLTPAEQQELDQLERACQAAGDALQFPLTGET